MSKALCLPKEARDKLKKALTSRSLKMADMHKMNDAELQAALRQYMDDDLAKLATAKFEQARLSKQKGAYKKWITSVTDQKDPVRRSMLKKVEKNKKYLTPDEEVGFQNALAEEKLGLAVSEEEAEQLLTLKKGVDDGARNFNNEKALAELEIDPQNKNAGWSSPEARLEYGLSVDDFKQYVSSLKEEALQITSKERLSPRNYGRNIVDLASATKSFVATLDNSFMGRQGLKTLLSGETKIWANAAKESFRDAGKEIMTEAPGLFKTRSDATMAAIRADVFSRPNAMLGKYTAAKNGYGLGLLHEEAFPSSIPEKIPGLGRVFKASETAFNGSAMRMRADLADAFIANADSMGLDTLDQEVASGLGKLTGSMTGRGEIGKLGAIGKEINVLLFAVRFLKSNFDTLTAHTFDKTMTPEVKKLAAKQTLKIAASITTMLTVAKAMDPDSVDFDPRSSKFGQICPSGERCYDVTGGMRGLVTLGSRLVPTIHDGELGWWTKSATTGKYTKRDEAEFGARTPWDDAVSFFEGKLSPSAQAFQDMLAREDFDGKQPTFVDSAIGLITPISAQTLMDELKEGNDDMVVAMIAETLGISNFKSSFRGSGKKWDKLKEDKGEDTYHKAVEDLTTSFKEKADKLRSSSRWDKMDNDAQNDALDAIRKKETSRVLLKYGGIR